MQNDQLKAMIEIGQSVSTSSATPQQAYNEIVRNREVMPQATGAVIEVIDGDMLRYAAARDDRIDVKDFSLPLAGSLSGLAIMSGAALICHDAEEDSRVDIEACRRVGLSSMIVTPIPYRGSYIGVLKFYSDQKKFIRRIRSNNISIIGRHYNHDTEPYLRGACPGEARGTHQCRQRKTRIYIDVNP